MPGKKPEVGARPYTHLCLAAFAMNEDREKYMNEGFDDYFSKPVNVDFLLQKIEQILQ